jgi:hypothetical protein
MKLVKQVTPLTKRNPSQSEEILNTNMRQKSKELQNLICRCRILTSGASYTPTTKKKTLQKDMQIINPENGKSVKLDKFKERNRNLFTYDKSRSRL